eukprot:gnl/TRDRNA2_/TRDRNA2_176163_c0_seq1.p2 gnl/TRDRNA2_/TRDRNA2_176163_c0~~gnl/TRDRNA2_/TRDRNA2_176163_c0_seq1.p2  ORF type:complete len:183 (+),score=18.52 gnl/TRDRNA2_/TRDRNA2_176163_c0_seq1:106-654(+)
MAPKNVSMSPFQRLALSCGFFCIFFCLVSGSPTYTTSAHEHGASRIDVTSLLQHKTLVTKRDTQCTIKDEKEAITVDANQVKEGETAWNCWQQSDKSPALSLQHLQPGNCGEIHGRTICRCQGTWCIEAHEACDGIKNCWDGSDELDHTCTLVKQECANGNQIFCRPDTTTPGTTTAPGFDK